MKLTCKYHQDSNTLTLYFPKEFGAINLSAGSVTTAVLADGSVTTLKIVDEAIEAVKLATASITSEKVATAAIGSSHLQDALVTTAKIANLAVDASRLADLTITAGKLASGSIGNGKLDRITDPVVMDTADIANAAIGSAQIANLAVGAAAIASGAIGTAKIADAAILEAKIDNAAVTSAKIYDAAIVSAKIADLAVIEAKIGNLAVNTAQIASLAVSSIKIANLAVTNAKIANLAVTNAKIANLAVTNAKIANLAVTNAKIAALDAAKITTGYLNANRIEAGSIVLSKITGLGDLATENNLDGVSNGTTYSKVLTTAISAGKIVLSSAGVSGTLPTSLSAAKCTDAAADETSTHTAYDTIRVNDLASTTIILAGKIGTGLVVANSIDVTNLSAISADLGSVTAGTITMPSTGWIKGGQTAYATGTGFFLGYSGAAYKFSFGSSTKYIKWDGSNLTLSDGLVTFNNLSPFIAGNLIEINNAAEVNMGVAGWTKKKEVYVARKGTLRIKFEMKGYETYGQIRRNGGIVGTERYYNGAIYQSYSEDIAGWSSGDRVQIYLKKTGGTGDAFVRKMEVCSDNPLISIIVL